MPFLPLLLNNWQLIVKAIGIAIIAFACWWYFVHNPKVIKQLEAEKAQAIRQVEAAHAAINLLQNIEATHYEQDKQSNENIGRIRKNPPRPNGIFIPGGVLAAVYQPYSAR